MNQFTKLMFAGLGIVGIVVASSSKKAHAEPVDVLPPAPPPPPGPRRTLISPEELEADPALLEELRPHWVDRLATAEGSGEVAQKTLTIDGRTYQIVAHPTGAAEIFRLSS